MFLATESEEIADEIGLLNSQSLIGKEKEKGTVLLVEFILSRKENYGSFVSIDILLVVFSKQKCVVHCCSVHQNLQIPFR